jgi:hypothetical protein
MTRCETMARLLPDVADDAASPAEFSAVTLHVRDCTHCRIQLARERRLSRAIADMREIEVDELFTAAVLERIPARVPKRRRDRRGLKLAIVGAIVAVGLGLAAPRELWGPGLPFPAAPALTTDVADPAVRGLAALAQTVMVALQTLFEGPLILGTVGAMPLPLLLVVALVAVAGLAFGSTLLVVLAGAYARSGSTAES